MMYKFLVVLAFSATAQLAFAGNYVLTIDKEPFDLTLGEAKRIKVDDQFFSVKIEQKSILTYTTDSFSFQYSNKYAPSKSDLGEGIFQTAMVTPLGSVVMVQEYQNMNPSGLMGMMINEVTKEERKYGYKIKSASNSITLSDGKKITGKVVTSKYKGSDIKRFFYTYGIKDSGLFIMTQIDYAIDSNNEEFIEKFINSLIITMK